jgi:hypothetical protein
MNILLAVGIAKNLSNADRKKEILSDTGLSAVSARREQNESDDQILTSKLQFPNIDNDVETPNWWPQVPSHDYQQLKQSMISVGCPDPVIIDVLTPLLFKDYFIRKCEIVSKLTPLPWLLDRPLMDSEKQQLLKEFSSILEEMDRLFVELNLEPTE